ncbi:hypothetical protein BXU01_13510 [[Flexibacter] sp. ATCC 35103]|nr:hypothetical protein BXU01_13510 [[Flexibacter] sp. ATCC 35103]
MWNGLKRNQNHSKNTFSDPYFPFLLFQENYNSEIKSVIRSFFIADISIQLHPSVIKIKNSDNKPFLHTLRM